VHQLGSKSIEFYHDLVILKIEILHLSSLCLHFFSPTFCPKAKFRKNSIYSNKLFHNFHLSESSFTCPWLWASGRGL